MMLETLNAGEPVFANIQTLGDPWMHDDMEVPDLRAYWRETCLTLAGELDEGWCDAQHEIHGAMSYETLMRLAGHAADRGLPAQWLMLRSYGALVACGGAVGQEMAA